MRTWITWHCGKVFATSLILVQLVSSSDAQTPRPPSSTPVVQAEEPQLQPFFAAGMLQKVRRKDNGAERIALTDGQGGITAFIAPTARIDLRSFIGREVAIKGRVLNANDDHAPYIAADKVTDIFAENGRRASGPGQDIARVNFEGEIPPNQFSPVQSIGTGPMIGTPWQPVGGQIYAGGSVMPGSIVQGPVVQGPIWDGAVMDGSMVQNSTFIRAYPGGPPAGFAVPGGPVQGGISNGPYSIPSGGGACGGGACGGDPCCTSCVNDCQPCPQCGANNASNCCCQTPEVCGPPGWLWVRGEYLIWWADGMQLPPLVTTGAIADDIPGALGQPGTTILYGNESVLESGRSGFRINFGGWFGPQRCLGWEGEYLDVGTLTETFTANASDFPVLARPFVNVNPNDGPGFQDAELVSFPGELDGTVTVDSTSQLRAAAGRFRFNICCRQCELDPCCNPCGYRRCGYPPYVKVDLTAGYRHANLQDSLRISEDLTSLNVNSPTRFQIFDEFSTTNNFHGGEVGTVFSYGAFRWSGETIMRLGLGNVRQEVDINGQTTITEIGVGTQTFTGGLLAQTTNIGSYQRDQFAMVPELASNLGWYLTPRLRITVGYTFFYLSNVVRPGDQIDLDVNTLLLPPSEPLQGLPRPEFAFRTTDFWAHGLNTGLDFRW